MRVGGSSLLTMLVRDYSSDAFTSRVDKQRLLYCTASIIDVIIDSGNQFIDSI